MSRLKAGKKRYMVSLTINNVDPLLAFMKEHDIPRAEFSRIIDYYICGLNECLAEIKKLEEKGEKITYGTLLEMVGRAIQRTLE